MMHSQDELPAPNVGALEPVIGGYLTPHVNPAVGQHRSNPLKQNVGEVIAEN